MWWLTMECCKLLAQSSDEKPSEIIICKKHNGEWTDEQQHCDHVVFTSFIDLDTDISKRLSVHLSSLPGQNR